ncbi:hypothetical protein [Alistipes sp. AF48-12]|uniref:hypothetical protein n=1 Tax=Alistipes sp. AF48-12 TaxID=2291998 RepID=UPI0011C46941|nr:hypothetical protein [Alistipes sp. AF48-12]
MVVLKHGELYLFSSTEEPYEDAFGVFECIDGGYILLRVMFNGRGMSRNCWLPDAYRIVRQATPKETGLFQEIVVRISRGLDFLKIMSPETYQLQLIVSELFSRQDAREEDGPYSKKTYADAGDPVSAYGRARCDGVTSGTCPGRVPNFRILCA